MCGWDGAGYGTDPAAAGIQSVSRVPGNGRQLYDTGAASGGGGSAASSTDSTGRASGESTGEDATSARFAHSMGGLLGAVAGPVGAAAATVLSAAASVGADLTNQMGVGHNTYVPDFTSSRRGNGQGPADSTAPDVRGDTPGAGTPPTMTPPVPSVAPGAGASPAAAAGAGGGVGAAAGAGGAAAAVPIVPV